MVMSVPAFTKKAHTQKEVQTLAGTQTPQEMPQCVACCSRWNTTRLALTAGLNRIRRTFSVGALLMIRGAGPSVLTSNQVSTYRTVNYSTYVNGGNTAVMMVPSYGYVHGIWWYTTMTTRSVVFMATCFRFLSLA